MKPHDTDPPPWEELRRSRPAPVVDVTQRVLASLSELPAPVRHVHQGAMTACAALCAAMAACIVLLASITTIESVDTDNPAEMVINIHEVEFRSLLP